MCEDNGNKRAWIAGALASGCGLGVAIGAGVGYFLGKRGSRFERQVARDVQELPDRLKKLSSEISARFMETAETLNGFGGPN